MTLNIAVQTTGSDLVSFPVTTASVTVGTNEVCYVAVGATVPSNWGNEQVTVSGLSLTWTSIGFEIFNRRLVQVFRAVNTGAEASGALTISFTGTSPQTLTYSVFKATGANVATPNDAAVNAEAAGTNTLTSPDVGTPGPGDHVVVLIGFEGAGDNFTIEGGWTTLTSFPSLSNMRQFYLVYDASDPQDEQISMNWDTVENATGIVAFIVNNMGVTPPYARDYAPDKQQIFHNGR
jgi:hypothetical protein